MSDELKALGLNCPLKASPEESNTESLMRRVLDLLEDHGVETEIIARSTTRSSSASHLTRATATGGPRCSTR